jgi:hypothetical protein
VPLAEARPDSTGTTVAGKETEMPSYMVLYVGAPTLPGASHEGWPEWFARRADHVVHRGSPLANGLALHADGSTNGATAHCNGYSIIQAEDIADVLGLLKDHPYLTQGREYSIEVYLMQ